MGSFLFFIFINLPWYFIWYFGIGKNIPKTSSASVTSAYCTRIAPSRGNSANYRASIDLGLKQGHLVTIIVTNYYDLAFS